MRMTRRELVTICVLLANKCWAGDRGLRDAGDGSGRERQIRLLVEPSSKAD